MKHTIMHELTDSDHSDSDHFIEARRLSFKTDVLENCHCGLWVLWEQHYNFCHEADDIPVSVDTFREKTNAFQSMTQAERTESRQYITDGLYEAEGVDFPCLVCGFHQPEEAIEISNQ